MRSVLITVIFFLLSSCDYKQLWEEEHYKVHWLDGKVSLVRKLSEQGDSIGRVDSEIIAVGSNKRYIVGKRKRKDKNTISYYFIDKLKDDNYLNPSEITQGPFTETEFTEMKQQLGLPSFSVNF